MFIKQILFLSILSTYLFISMQIHHEMHGQSNNTKMNSKDRDKIKIKNLLIISLFSFLSFFFLLQNSRYVTFDASVLATHQPHSSTSVFLRDRPIIINGGHLLNEEHRVAYA